MRELCTGCLRSRRVCWCGDLEPFDPGLRVDILMHPRERRVTIGTGRIVHRSLSGSRLWVGERFGDESRLWSELADHRPLVLFPGERALNLDALEGPEDYSTLEHLELQDTRLSLIVIDGTWTQAKQILKRSPRLDALPKLMLRPTTRARYDQLRREPRLECHSTLESVHALLDRLAALGLVVLPDGRPHDRMLAVLDALIAEQVAFVPEHHLANRLARGATRGQREPRGPTTR